MKSEKLSSLASELLSSDRVKEACAGEDIEVAAIEAHFGLHAVYDLHEAYFRPLEVRKISAQDHVYAATGGEAVGALVLARGARTHRLVTFASPGGFGGRPYGMGPYGDGWIWKDHTWADRDFQLRARWSRDHGSPSTKHRPGSVKKFRREAITLSE